jgi:hypothetical protein
VEWKGEIEIGAGTSNAACGWWAPRRLCRNKRCCKLSGSCFCLHDRRVGILPCKLEFWVSYN